MDKHTQQAHCTWLVCSVSTYEPTDEMAALYSTFTWIFGQKTWVCLMCSLICWTGFDPQCSKDPLLNALECINATLPKKIYNQYLLRGFMCLNVAEKSFVLLNWVHLEYIHCNCLKSWLLSSCGLSVLGLICDEISYLSLRIINRVSGSLDESVCRDWIYGRHYGNSHYKSTFIIWT